MGAKHYFFKRVCDSITGANKPPEHPHSDPSLKGFSGLEIVEVIREKYCYVIYMNLPGSSRVFKFSIKRDGSVRGFSHNQTLELTESCQQTIREKFRLYFKQNQSYIISNNQ